MVIPYPAAYIRSSVNAGRLPKCPGLQPIHTSAIHVKRSTEGYHGSRVIRHGCHLKEIARATKELEPPTRSLGQPYRGYELHVKEKKEETSRQTDGHTLLLDNSVEVPTDTQPNRDTSIQTHYTAHGPETQQSHALKTPLTLPTSPQQVHNHTIGHLSVPLRFSHSYKIHPKLSYIHNYYYNSLSLPCRLFLSSPSAVPPNPTSLTPSYPSETHINTPVAPELKGEQRGIMNTNPGISRH